MVWRGPGSIATLRKVFDGPIIPAGGFDQANAEKILKKGDADLVAFGRIFIANPDLPDRMRNGYPLAQHKREYFFGALR